MTDKPRITMEDSEVHDGPGYHSSLETHDIHLNQAIGVKIGQYGTPFPHQPPVFCALLDWTWTLVPWWVRLLGLIRLPYDVVKFIITGRFTFIPWPWRW